MSEMMGSALTPAVSKMRLTSPQRIRFGPGEVCRQTYGCLADECDFLAEIMRQPHRDSADIFGNVTFHRRLRGLVPLSVIRGGEFPVDFLTPVAVRAR